MTDSIFHLGADGALIEMHEQPYESEDLLQTLLSKYPNLLAGAQMDPDEPRRWLLIRREAGVPGEADSGDRWSVDHLFLDQDGIPTLVEVKRSSDTRIRREVVGQMLDYAANAVAYWPAERIRAEFEARYDGPETDSSQALKGLIGDHSEDDFWEQVKTNLRAGRIRLVFVADVLPPELRRIIEFLNEQTDPLEVLGVEVRQYVGGDDRTIVPRVIGRTVSSEQRKSSAGRPKRKWNEAAFFEQLGEHGADAVRRGQRLLEWAKNEGLRVWFGEGTITGSFIPLLDLPGGKAAYSFSAWTNDRVQVEFMYMGRSGRYATEEERLPLLERLNTLPGIDLPSVNGEPSFRLSELPDDQVLEDFLAVWDEYLAGFRQ